MRKGNDERTPLLNERATSHDATNFDQNALETGSSEVEQKLEHISIGERLPYGEYSSIDFLHDLVGN